MIRETLHSVVQILEQPVIYALFIATAFALMDIGTLIGERLRGIASASSTLSRREFEQIAHKRVRASDTLVRIGPMLGLMGTLIPLGPGLDGLATGDLSLLAGSITVAFDTTVLGLLIGLLAFCSSRTRRSWYDTKLQKIKKQETGV